MYEYLWFTDNNPKTTMRAPLSTLAKTVLDNPDGANQLQNFLDSGNTTGSIQYTTEDGKQVFVRAAKRNTVTATHGFSHKPNSTLYLDYCLEPLKDHWKLMIGILLFILLCCFNGGINWHNGSEVLTLVALPGIFFIGAGWVFARTETDWAGDFIPDKIQSRLNKRLGSIWIVTLVGLYLLILLVK